MSLHKNLRPTIRPTYQFIADEDYEGDFYEDNGECPRCGSNQWSNTFYGRYYQNAYYTFNSSRYVDFDSLTDEDGANDSDVWECSNGHTATDTIAEMIEGAM